MSILCRDERPVEALSHGCHYVSVDERPGAGDRGIRGNRRPVREGQAGTGLQCHEKNGVALITTVAELVVLEMSVKMGAAGAGPEAINVWRGARKAIARTTPMSIYFVPFGCVFIA